MNAPIQAQNITTVASQPIPFKYGGITSFPITF
jgi:hypothetical protein